VPGQAPEASNLDDPALNLAKFVKEFRLFVQVLIEIVRTSGAAISNVSLSAILYPKNDYKNKVNYTNHQRGNSNDCSIV
jgi:hypothetical protein